MNLCSKCFAGMFLFFYALMCFKCTSRWDWSWSRLIFVSPNFHRAHCLCMLALSALRHGSWSWSASILDGVCISVWQHGGIFKLCPWSSSVLLYGENTYRGCFWLRPPQNCTRQQHLTQIVSWIWSIFRIKHLKPNHKNRKGEPCHYLDYEGMIETRKWPPKKWPNWEVNECSAPQMLHHWQAAGGNWSCVWWTKAAVYTWCLKAASGENLDSYCNNTCFCLKSDLSSY